jgi:hypothetical protein
MTAFTPIFAAAPTAAQRLREAQILETLDLEGPTPIRRLVDRLYRHVEPSSRDAAAQEILTLLVRLTADGRVECRHGLPTLHAVYDLHHWRAAA